MPLIPNPPPTNPRPEPPQAQPGKDIHASQRSFAPHNALPPAPPPSSSPDDTFRTLDRYSLGDTIRRAYFRHGHDSWCSIADEVLDKLPLTNFAFLLQMDAEIKANNHKGPWENWKPERFDLISEMQHHLNKLAGCLQGAPITSASGRPCTIAELSADLANFAMKAFECFGEPSSVLNPPSSQPIPCCPHFPDCEHANNEKRSHVVEGSGQSGSDPRCPKCGAAVVQLTPGQPWRCVEAQQCGWEEARD